MKWFLCFFCLFVGHLPAFHTALTEEGYLHFVDYLSIFAGWAFGMLFLELCINHDFRKELERKTKVY